MLIANDSWIELTVRYVVDYRRRRSTRNDLHSRILDEIDRTDGKAAMASMTVQLVEWPRLDVRLTGEASPTPPASDG
ncbi:MAG: hypothetical protein ACMG6S_10565 [Byssovorax sp.]